MALAEYASGSASISTTEYSLVNNSTTIATDATDGVYQLFIDFNALTVTELYEVKFYEKVRSADSQRVCYEAYVQGPLGAPVWVSPSVLLMHGWDMTLTKISGTDQTITWSIRQVG